MIRDPGRETLVATATWIHWRNLYDEICDVEPTLVFIIRSCSGIYDVEHVVVFGK